VEMEQKQQLVYKHAISTVAPIRPIGNLSLDAKSEDD
jgi:host factor-I protein